MNNFLVIEHIEKILNNCGDNVFISPTGNIVNANTDISIEIKDVEIYANDKCFVISEPFPKSN